MRLNPFDTPPGWHRVRVGVVAAIALMLAYAVPATAQAPALSLEADPASGTAPLDVTLHALSDPPVNATWRVFYVDVDDQMVELGNGTTLPAQLQLQFGPGTFDLRLAVALGNDTRIASTSVEAAAPLHQGTVNAPWIAGDVVPLAVAGLLMLSLAAWLVVRDPTNRLNLAFALLFSVRGLADLTNGLLANRTVGRLRLDPAVMDRLHPAVTIAVVAAAVYFLFVYLGQNNARVAKMRPGPATLGIAGLFILLALWRPALYWGTPGAQGGILLAFTGLYYPLYTVIVYLLVRESRKDIPDDRRAGAFSSAVGFLFLPAFVGAGEFLFVDVLGYFRQLETGTGIGFAIGHWAAVLGLIPLGMAAAIMVHAAIHEPERRHTRLHAGIFLGALGIAVGSLLLPLAAYEGVGTLGERSIAVARLFWVFQGIWAIPYAVLVAWGITRYQASTQQTRMRRQLRRFGLATLFFTIFFAVSEGLEGLASSKWGNEIGLTTAALLTVALGPVQERLQKRFVQAPPETQTSQEIKFYEEQLRRTLLDGVIGEQERKFLGNLQVTMGITDDTAKAIEERLVAERAGATPDL